MPRKRKPFKVKNQEEGRGPVETKSFATLIEAQQYIRERWQGADYIDGSAAFHTDYCTYELVGFKLSDIGTIRPVYWTDDDGKQRLDYMEYDFKDLTAEAA